MKERKQSSFFTLYTIFCWDFYIMSQTILKGLYFDRNLKVIVEFCDKVNIWSGVE